MLDEQVYESVLALRLGSENLKRRKVSVIFQCCRSMNSITGIPLDALHNL